jgi:hypothetical protein
MATLTAAGIDCSNGTLNGQYTGTLNINSTYPIGSFICTVDISCIAALALNAATAAIYTNTAISNTGQFRRTSPGGAGLTTIAGTWRCRGATINTAGTNTPYLFQRVA